MSDAVGPHGRGTAPAAARSHTRWGLAISSVLLSLPAAHTILDFDAWPALTQPLLALVLVSVVTVHIVVSLRAVDSHDARSRFVLALPLVAASAMWVGVAVVAPEHRLAWTALLGVGLSYWVIRGSGTLPTLLTAAGVVALVTVGALVSPGDVGSPLDPALDGSIARTGLSVLVLLVPLTVDGSQLWWWRVLQRLEHARELADELATTRERVRIGAELHDVQGHSLQVIALEAELVERLVLVDPQSAKEHAHTVRTLASDAMHETRSLVRGYRVSDLAAEIRNATQVLRSGGADAVITGDPSVLPAGTESAFAPLVREATTNILRHSNPTHVEIIVESDRELRLTITNDGVVEVGDESTTGTGLAGLRERFEQLRGTVRVNTTAPGSWSLTGAIPAGATKEQSR